MGVILWSSCCRSTCFFTCHSPWLEIQAPMSHTTSLMSFMTGTGWNYFTVLSRWSVHMRESLHMHELQQVSDTLDSSTKHTFLHFVSETFEYWHLTLSERPQNLQGSFTNTQHQDKRYGMIKGASVSSYTSKHSGFVRLKILIYSILQCK